MKLTIELKKKLFSYCEDYVNMSIKTLENALEDAQDAANSDTKGSAGDKHETGRAMMHIEKENNAKILAERLNLRKTLALINPEEKHVNIKLGSLISTSNGIFFLAIPIGKVKLEEDFFIISPVSPIGKLLMEKKKGEEFSFNSKIVQIINVF